MASRLGKNDRSKGTYYQERRALSKLSTTADNESISTSIILDQSEMLAKLSETNEESLLKKI